MSTDKLKIYVPAIILALLGFAFAYQFVDPAPPSTLTFSAGQQDGAYYAYAKRYRDYLKQRGISVKILESAGSLENIRRLTAGKADIAFVQSGIVHTENPHLQSLGSMYYEPLWIFLRNGLDVHSLRELKGKRIAVGMNGSGTQALGMQLLKANGIDAHTATLRAMGSADAAKGLQQGNIDAVFIVSAVNSKTVQSLLHGNSSHVMNIARAEAYTRRIESLSAIRLPEGALDLGRNLPSEDIQLLASTATLVVNANLHPALQGLIMQAATSIHSKHSLFADADTFPTGQFTGMALSSEAVRYYKFGPPFLQRFMPFWAATLVDRLKVMLLPLIALLFPLFKVMPPLYRWRIRSRIYRWYEELIKIDTSLNDGLPANALNQLVHDLDRIDLEIRKVHVPLSYAQELYDLRLHLNLVREQVEQAK